MKKNFLLIVGLFCCGFIFTSFSPSIDGRAVVAQDGVMPKGVFARTVGYLPGDSISVTNLAKKSTVDILVIGALDPSEGIAILLTPEAADLLGMDRKKNNVVKVTKRSGQLDETVSGTAVIGDVIDEDFDFAEEEAESAEIAETVEVEEEAELESPVVALEEEEEDEEDFEEEDYVPLETEEILEYAYAYEPYDEEIAEEEFEEPEIPVAAALEEPVFEKVNDRDDFAPEKAYVASEKVNEDDLAEYDFDLYEVPDEYEEEVFVADDFEEVERVPDVYIEREDDKVASNSFDEDAPPKYVKVEDVDEGFNEVVSSALFEEVEEDEEIAYSPEVDLEEEPVENDLEEYVAEDEIPELAETEENVESYDAIVLVPADPKAPEEPVECDELDEVEYVLSSEGGIAFEDSSDEGDAAANEGADAEEGIVLVPVLDEEVVVAAKDEERATTQIDDGYSFDKYMVSDLKSLESGNYYVQIAIYNDNMNIQAVLDAYSENYPIVIVPTASGRANQVMVGPLNIDEYGTVLNRFKSYGYKDAFLRKIR